MLAVRLLSEKPQKAGADACCEPRPKEAARRGQGQRA
jgi:hypothetical protein